MEGVEGDVPIRRNPFPPGFHGTEEERLERNKDIGLLQSMVSTVNVRGYLSMC